MPFESELPEKKRCYPQQNDERKKYVSGRQTLSGKDRKGLHPAERKDEKKKQRPDGIFQSEKRRDGSVIVHMDSNPDQRAWGNPFPT
jgi:hypothetical protein